MRLQAIRNDVQSYGVAAVVHDLTKRGVNRVVPFRLLRVLKLTRDRVDPRFLDIPSGFHARFAEADELAAWSLQPGYPLKPEFLTAAVERGERCYAISRGSELSSYGWYSRKPTKIDPSVELHFDPAWVYRYKGFTLPKYRGNRLHAIGLARALQHYVEHDAARGVLSYVESNNFASLKSCYRVGYEAVGTILISTFRGRRHAYATPACADYGLRVVTA